MIDEQNTKPEAATDPQDMLNALVSRTTIDDAKRISRRATLIKRAELSDNMNHCITEGDIWAVVTALREISHTG